MDISGTLSAVSTALGIVKQIKEIDAQIDKADLKLKIAEITSALADAKLGIIDAEESLRDKDAEIKKLSGLLKYKAENTTRYNSMLYEAENGEPVGRPYCPVCEQTGTLIKLVQDMFAPGHPFKCPNCKANMGRVSVKQASDGKY